MPEVRHVREELWDEHTKEFRLRSLPTVPDVELPILRDDLSVSPGGSTVIGSVTVPPGTVLRVTYLKYLTSDPRGALFSIAQNGSAVDYPYLPSAGETIVKEGVDNPVYVLEGTVEVYLNAVFGAVSPGTVYGLVLHGYYSRQEELGGVT
ncbi:MAG: hypothetical protein DRO39_06625 [Thermoprotei archaeon]|nr:MAG: hypothetical protein DRO39_06625 [Thermoprotei archaeon]